MIKLMNCDRKEIATSLERKSYYQDLSRRVALMALPFICLHKPSGKVITVGAHAYTAISCLQNLSDAKSVSEVVHLSSKATLAAASIVFALLYRPFALAGITMGDMLLDIRQLALCYQSGDMKSVANLSCSLISSAFYVGMLVTGLPEIILLALTTQALCELRTSYLEFKEDRQIEGYGHLALALVRVFQAAPTARITYTKWMASKEELKIVSFNILSDTTLGWFGDAVEKRPDDFKWEQRIERIHEGLIKIDADVICLQEVEPKSYAYLKDKLGPGYESQLALNDNKKFGVATFVKKSSVELNSVERQLYPGTTGRIVQIVDITAKKDGKQLTVANTHLDQPTRDSQMEYLTRYLNSERSYQERVICGDWNAKKTDDVFQVLKANGYFYDPKECPTNTHQNTELKQIDGIAHTAGIQSSTKAWKSIELDTVLPNKEIASDHVPLIGDLSWKPLAQIQAEMYRKVGLFFDSYWDWNKVKKQDKKECVV